MSIITHILPGTDEKIVCIGFEVKYDKDSDQLDHLYRALHGIPGSRVAYVDSKKVRADLRVIPQK